MTQLHELARPFPRELIAQKPGKFAADYVSHALVNARLLEVVGPYSWSVLRHITNADGTVVGCIGRLELEVDGRPVVIEEVGDVERPSGNAASDLKAAASDAYKRCAMRLGLGLHLWAGEHYFLDRALAKREAEAAEKEAAGDGDADRPA
jgi:hypothetical protein